MSIFTDEEVAKIVETIRKAELKTSGEIRVHIAQKLKKNNPLDEAAMKFAELEMHKTEERNGILFYIATEDRKFAVLGDKGIHSKVNDGFWTGISERLSSNFKEGFYLKGILEGIEICAEKLQYYFPRAENDTNELSNEVTFSS